MERAGEREDVCFGGNERYCLTPEMNGFLCSMGHIMRFAICSILIFSYTLL